jgi:hypothetical protein
VKVWRFLWEEIVKTSILGAGEMANDSEPHEPLQIDFQSTFAGHIEEDPCAPSVSDPATEL